MASIDGKLSPPSFTSFEWNSSFDDSPTEPNEDRSDGEVFEPLSFGASSCSVSSLVALSDDGTLPTVSDPAPAEGKKRRVCFSDIEATCEPHMQASLRRKKKPKGALPKRPLSAYSIFFQKERIKLKEESPGTGKGGPGELGKIIGQRWRCLSESELAFFDQLAKDDKERYHTEMQAYGEGKQKKVKETNQLSSVDNPSAGHAFAMDMPAVTRTFKLPQPPRSTNNVCNEAAPQVDRYQTREPCSEPSFQEVHHHHDTEKPFFSQHVQRPAHSQYQRPCEQIPSSGTYQGHYHFSQPPRNGTFYPSDVPSGIFPSLPPNTLAIPPGQQLMLPDSNGVIRQYRVDYSAVSMTVEEAKKYLQEMSGAA